MSTEVDHALGRFASVDLAELDAEAAMLRRKDRKYIVDPADLEAVLAEVSGQVRVLETDVGRWATYESIYLDTAELDLFHLAARRRPSRAKVRLRRYLDSGLDMSEIKVKDRRGQTVKHRRPIRGASDASLADGSLAEVISDARAHRASADLASSLRPTLTTRYRRATLLLPEGAGRATIDLDFVAFAPSGESTALAGRAIVETKTDGRPSALDRLLWRHGHRPVKFSKYCTALAALDRELPANRWHRVTGHLTPTPHTHGAVR